MATGVWMAKDSGAFEKNGIQADLIFISSGPVVVQALIGGDLHGGSAATNAVVNAILSGAPIIGVAGTANRPYHRLYVQPEINRVEDLKGKTLGVTRFGSITDNLTRILLRKAGLEGAVAVRQMGGTLEVAAAFQNRQIAGAVTGDLRVAPPSQPKLLIKLIDFGIPYSMNTIAVSRDYLRRAPETVERIVRAYAEGVAFMNQQKERSIRAIMKYAHMRDPKDAEEHYRDSVTYLEKVTRAEPDAVQTILEFIGKKGDAGGDVHGQHHRRQTDARRIFRSAVQEALKNKTARSETDSENSEITEFGIGIGRKERKEHKKIMSR